MLSAMVAPKKKPAPARSRITAVTVRLTVEEHERFAAAAQKNGLGVSSWLRMLGMQSSAS